MAKVEFTVSRSSHLVRSVQDEVRRRLEKMPALEGQGLEAFDFDQLHFEEGRYASSASSIRGSVEIAEDPIGFLLFESTSWPWSPISFFGGIALTDGTTIELYGHPKSSALLRVVAGDTRFDIVGLRPGYDYGPETSLRRGEGFAPRAFEARTFGAPWLGSTDWRLRESVRFKMGRPELEASERVPFLTLCALDWYRARKVELMSD